jgi:hypothetical protein
MPKLHLSQLGQPSIAFNFQLTSSKPPIEDFGGHVKIHSRSSEQHKPRALKLIKVLSDTDDPVTRAIKKAERRDKDERRRIKEHRRLNGTMGERNYIRSKIYSETGVSLPTPTVRKGYRGKVNESSVTSSATLAMHHIKRFEKQKENVMALVPDLGNIGSIRKRTHVLGEVVKRMEEIEEMGMGGI